MGADALPNLIPVFLPPECAELIAIDGLSNRSKSLKVLSGSAPCNGPSLAGMSRIILPLGVRGDLGPAGVRTLQRHGDQPVSAIFMQK
eukprot:COSAG02_NODE_1934_length_10318_cov_74.374009_3_plen_88_part_00